MRATDTEIAYMAGLVDGEGSLQGYVRTIHPRKGVLEMRLTVSNTSLPMLEWIELRCGGYIRLRAKAGPAGDGTWRRNRPVYDWILHRREADELIRAMLPYLVAKRAEAEAWLRLSALIGPRGSTRIVNWDERRAVAAELASFKGKKG